MEKNETPTSSILRDISELAAKSKMLDEMVRVCHEKVHAAEQKIYCEKERTEVEWLCAIEEYFKSEEALDDLKTLARSAQTKLKKGIALATAVMSISEFKKILELDDREFLVRKMPMCFTGKLLQISLSMSLADAAYQLVSEWNTRGMSCRVNGLTGGRELRLTIAGTPRAVLGWILGEERDALSQDSEILADTLCICEDEALIEEYLKIQASPDEF